MAAVLPPRAGRLGARVLDEDELTGNWTPVGDELEQLSGRRGATKLGFALLLRFYAVRGRFLAGRSEIPDQAVAHVAQLADVPAAELSFYEWDGRTIRAHPADIRRYFGFRECSVADADKAAEWLAANVCEKERQAGQVREELLCPACRGAVPMIRWIRSWGRGSIRSLFRCANHSAGLRTNGYAIV